MNWYGGVTQLVEDIDSPSPKDARSMRNLSWFQEALVRLTVLVEGAVTVVAIPRTDNKAHAQGCISEGEATSSEDIVAVSLWLPPGKTLDVGPVTVFRSGLLKVLRGWGFGGVTVSRCNSVHAEYVVIHMSAVSVCYSTSRQLWNAAWRSRSKPVGSSDSTRGTYLQWLWTPTIRRRVCDVIRIESLNRSWCSCSGYSSMLMEEGFRRTSPKPVHLEATTPANRDIYAHLGFEVLLCACLVAPLKSDVQLRQIDEVHQFGVGQVDKNGIRAKGEAATGYPEWIMTKARYPSSQLVMCDLTTPASPQWST